MELTEDQQKVQDLLDAHPHLSRGVGTEDEPCTIAAVNMALTSKLTDNLHPCVSPIIRSWVMVTQDAMPDAAATAARYATDAARAADADYWQRRDPAGLLAELVAMATNDRRMKWQN